MTTAVMKIEVQMESCCVCGLDGAGELMTPEEYDASAGPPQVPLRAMLLHLNNNKVLPDGRLCLNCIRRTTDAYEFSTTLSTRTVPPLSEKIRALRRRLHELTQKIDVFIVVGGPGVNAGGTYSEEDIIMVDKDALAAATAADDEDMEKSKNARGETVYQCSVCPLSFQRLSEFRAHEATHAADAPHSCWTCGAQFSSRQRARPPQPSLPTRILRRLSSKTRDMGNVSMSVVNESDRGRDNPAFQHERKPNSPWRYPLFRRQIDRVDSASSLGSSINGNNSGIKMSPLGNSTLGAAPSIPIHRFRPQIPAAERVKDMW